MAQIPTYEQWMKDTSSLTSPRSTYLKLLDESIKTYGTSKSADSKSKVKEALDRWRFEQSKEGKDWKTSVRNQKGAVTNLFRAVNELDKRKLTAAELEALKYIAAAQKLALAKQFGTASLRFKQTTLMGMAQNAGSTWTSFKTGASAVASGGSMAKTGYTAGKGLVQGIQGAKPVAAQASSGASAMIRMKVEELVHTMCAELNADQVLSALHLGTVASFTAELTPFVGAISSGGKAVMGWIDVVKKQYEAGDIESRRYAFKAGDPAAAFDSMGILIDREIASAAIGATTQTVAFTAKALGAVADFGAVTGPVVGLLTLLAKVIQMVIEYVRDYRECNAGSSLLRTGPLDFDLFNVSPILGCYFLVIQDHSTIINFAVGDYGTPNFVFDVEALVKKIDPVLAKARGFISASRLEVPGMANAKGIMEANYSVATGLGKVTGLPGHIKDTISDKVAGWIEKPERIVVDKSRIVGFGSKP